MDIKELIAKRSRLEAQFEEKKATRERAISEVASLFDEMNVLKGAYSALTEIIDTPVAKPEDPVEGEVVEPEVKVEGE